MERISGGNNLLEEIYKSPLKGIQTAAARILL
jgi:hypothetical protein